MSEATPVFMTSDEVEALVRAGATLPSQFQLGQQVWLWEYPENRPPFYTPAVVVGVTFDWRVTYTLGFKVDSNNRYLIRGGFRGFISKPGNFMDEEGGLVSIPDIQEYLMAQARLDESVRRPQLYLVTNTDTGDSQ